MYIFKIVQPRKADNVLTRIKVILCESVLNTLIVSIWYDMWGHDKTLHYVPRVKSDAGPTSVLHFRYSWSCFPPLSPQAPWGIIYWNVVVSSPGNTWHDARSFSICALWDGHLYDVVALDIHVRPLEALIIFFMEELTPFFLEEVKLSWLIFSHVGFLLPPFACRSTRCLIGAAYFHSTLGTLDQVLQGEQPCFAITLTHYGPSGSKPLSLSETRLYYNSTFTALPWTCALGWMHKMSFIFKVWHSRDSLMDVLRIISWCVQISGDV